MTEENFFAILPHALKALAGSGRNPGDPDRRMSAMPYHEDGRKTSPTRYNIQTPGAHDRHTPLTAVAWFWRQQHFDISNEKGAAQALNLEPHFAARLCDAIGHRRGFSKPLRQRLLGECGLGMEYLEPTTP